MSQPTYGISIGRDNHGAVAAGDHAQAVQNSAAPGVESVVAELSRIRAAIEHADGVTDRHKALRDVDARTTEVRQEDPDTDAISAAFVRLVGRVKPVAAVATAVYQAWALVENMVGGA